MYVIDRSIKFDLARQWALPDRVFFAAGACQVLAFAAWRLYGGAGLVPRWIRPAAGFRGNHIIVTDGETAFDYHGWSSLPNLLAHATRKANRWWPGWSFELLDIAPDALISEEKSKALGCHMREPRQFLRDALPRAQAFLERRIPPAHIKTRASS